MLIGLHDERYNWAIEPERERKLFKEIIRTRYVVHIYNPSTLTLWRQKPIKSSKLLGPV
jgi:hypothetical protein